MKIIVTDEDIINGIPENEYECPIALACKRMQLGDNITVEDAITYLKDNKAYIIHLPIEVEDFIQTFDNHLPVEPFEFEAEPEEVED